MCHMYEVYVVTNDVSIADLYINRRVAKTVSPFILNENIVSDYCWNSMFLFLFVLNRCIIIFRYYNVAFIKIISKVVCFSVQVST